MTTLSQPQIELVLSFLKEGASGGHSVVSAAQICCPFLMTAPRPIGGYFTCMYGLGGKEDSDINLLTIKCTCWTFPVLLQYSREQRIRHCLPGL